MRKTKISKPIPALNQARKYYLAYGMNTNLDAMRTRCPDAVVLGTVTLPGHRLVFDHHCDVRKDAKRDVECVLWSITGQCENQLDQLEGYPEYYNKKEVTVEYQGSKIKAMVYYMANRNESYESLPSDSYLNTVNEGYNQNNISIMQLKKALVSAYKEEKLYPRTLSHSYFK